MADSDEARDSATAPDVPDPSTDSAFLDQILSIIPGSLGRGSASQCESNNSEYDWSVDDDSDSEEKAESGSEDKSDSEGELDVTVTEAFLDCEDPDLFESYNPAIVLDPIVDALEVAYSNNYGMWNFPFRLSRGQKLKFFLSSIYCNR